MLEALCQVTHCPGGWSTLARQSLDLDVTFFKVSCNATLFAKLVMTSNSTRFSDMHTPNPRCCHRLSCCCCASQDARSGSDLGARDGVGAATVCHSSCSSSHSSSRRQCHTKACRRCSFIQRWQRDCGWCCRCSRSCSWWCVVLRPVHCSLGFSIARYHQQVQGSSASRVP